jgi:hypothetical protein
MKGEMATTKMDSDVQQDHQGGRDVDGRREAGGVPVQAAAAEKAEDPRDFLHEKHPDHQQFGSSASAVVAAMAPSNVIIDSTPTDPPCAKDSKQKANSPKFLKEQQEKEASGSDNLDENCAKKKDQASSRKSLEQQQGSRSNTDQDNEDGDSFLNMDPSDPLHSPLAVDLVSPGAFAHSGISGVSPLDESLDNIQEPGTYSSEEVDHGGIQDSFRRNTSSTNSQQQHGGLVEATPCSEDEGKDFVVVAGDFVDPEAQQKRREERQHKTCKMVALMALLLLGFVLVAIITASLSFWNPMTKAAMPTT